MIVAPFNNPITTLSSRSCGTTEAAPHLCFWQPTWHSFRFACWGSPFHPCSLYLLISHKKYHSFLDDGNIPACAISLSRIWGRNGLTPLPVGLHWQQLKQQVARMFMWFYLSLLLGVWSWVYHFLLHYFIFTVTLLVRTVRVKSNSTLETDKIWEIKASKSQAPFFESSLSKAYTQKSSGSLRCYQI